VARLAPSCSVVGVDLSARIITSRSHCGYSKLASSTATMVRMLEALADLATRLTPAPALELPTVSAKHADDFDGWSRLSFSIERSTRPPPPGLPTVRDLQRQQGEVLLDWLERLL
jgi:hypothetical protein